MPRFRYCGIGYFFFLFCDSDSSTGNLTQNIGRTPRAFTGSIFAFFPLKFFFFKNFRENVRR